MGLNDLERKFSEEDFEKKEEQRRSSVYNVDDAPGVETPNRIEDDQIDRDQALLLSQEREKMLQKKRRKGIFYAALGLTFVGVVTFSFILNAVYRDFAFDEKDVVISIEGPQEISAGLDVTYKVTVENNNQIELKNTSLVVQFPSGFEPQSDAFTMRNSAQKGTIKVGDLASGKTFSHEIKGKFSGNEGEVMYLDFFALYETSVKEGQFEKRTQFSTLLENSSFSLDVVGILEVTPGEKSEYQIRYSNNTNNTIYNAQIVVDSSQGFAFEKSEPEVSKEEVSRFLWNVGTLNPGDSNVIRLWGAYYQEAGSKGVISAKVGYIQGDGVFFTLSQKETTTIVSSSLIQAGLVVRTAENVVSVGQDVNMSIIYENTGDVALKSVIAQLVFDGDVWDYDNLSLKSGNWNQEKRTITWRASDVPELSDLSLGEKGEINFSVPVRKSFQITGAKDRNFFSTLRVTVDSPDALSRLGLKHVAGRAEQKVKMQTFADVKVEILEASTGTNFSSIRFIKDQEVVYNVKLRVENPYNDISGAKLSVSIPSVSDWNNFISGVDKEAVSYDERKRKVEWDLGVIRAGTGVYENAREITFSIRFTPKEYQENSVITILSEIDFSGKDTFVERDIYFRLQDPQIYMGIL